MAARRIVLIGKTGDGKSSTGNTILGEQLFNSRTSARSETGHVEAKEKTISGRTTTVVDTPGLFNTKSQNALKAAIDDCIAKCFPGPNVFIIILRIGLHGEQEREVVKEIESLLGQEVFRYSIVLFTHGDDLNEGQTIEEFVAESTDLKKLVKKCGGRCHVLDNKYWNQEHEYRSNSVQVKKLLNSIDELIMENGDNCYTKEMLKRWDVQILRDMWLQFRRVVWLKIRNENRWIRMAVVGFCWFGGVYCFVNLLKFLRIIP